MATDIELELPEFAVRRQLFPGVPEPQEEVEALFRTVEALKIGYEQLTRGRGDTNVSAVMVDELKKFIAGLETQLQTLSAQLAEQPTEPGGSGTVVSEDAGNVIDSGSDGGAYWDGDYNDLINKPPSGATSHDQLTGVTPNQHHNQVHLLYGPDHSDVNTSVGLSYGLGLFYDDATGEFKLDRRTYTHFQPTTPSAARSNAGDLWLITT